MTALAKATVETEAVHKEDTDDRSVETKEVDLMAGAKATAETEAIFKEGFAEETNRHR